LTDGNDTRGDGRPLHRGRGWFTLALLVVIAFLGWRAMYWLPENAKPWGQVQLDRKPTMFANWQINILAFAPRTCRAALDRAKIKYVALPFQPEVDGCGIDNGVRVTSLGAKFSSPVDATCSLTAALAWWEEAANKHAKAILGSNLARIDQIGTYACRNVIGSPRLAGSRSMHATANAIDVAGFRLANGKRISVERDWGKPTPEGRFLAAVRGEGCRFFNAVLSPDYNRAHHDHFHLDLGFWRTCS
jgi:hypothetical protein